MSYLHEKVSYLQGLADGLNIDTGSDTGKLLQAMIHALDDFADEIEVLSDYQEQLSQAIEECLDLDEYDDEEDYENFVITCDKCGNDIEITEEMLDSIEDLKCPVCGEVIHIEFDDECDCGCDHCH